MTEYKMVTVLGKQMSGYALSIWIGCLLGLILFIWQARSRGVKTGAMWLTVLLGIPIGLLCARMYYVLARFSLFQDIGFENFFVAEDEELRAWGAANGAAFWGAAGGVALAALAAGRISKEKTGRILDALAPSAALAIAMSRFGEYSIGEGVGPDVTPESLWFFPVAVVNEWEEWKYALFLLEGLAGLLIFLLLMTAGRKKTNGYRARMFIILYASSQAVFEALRRDNFLRWLFVRVSQVCCAVVLAFLIAFAVFRWMKSSPETRMPRKKLILCCALFLAMVGAVVALEFAVDKSPTLSPGMAYLLETVCCGVMGYACWQIIMDGA
ncbi:MAG: prolipoprotein diacylglyceryl transferase [Clostridia bacterium]|nr:prolipoprotein diacylglyceryl transferase [Clostridia bacterium]